MQVDLLVLNFNGRQLLAECLPSVVRAAEASRHACRVLVVDNASTDGSPEYLRERFADVEVIECINYGLASFNDVLAKRASDVAILLNNDIRLAEDAVDPLLEPFERHGEAYAPKLFMTAPLCWLFDGATYEGFRTAVLWRCGLVRATAHFEGHQRDMHVEGPTASAGAVMAVDRRLFGELRGFDPLYFPGRIEDLDLAFRAHQSGYEALYIPRSVAYHRGHATFGAVHGDAGSMHLAIRNTLLFQWKNLRHPSSIARHLSWLPLRLTADVVRSVGRSQHGRFRFTRAFVAALARAPSALRSSYRTPPSRRREREFFAQFAPRRMASAAPDMADAVRDPRVADYPISRWYLRPLAAWVAVRLAHSRVRPWHVTLAGLAAAVAAAAAVSAWPHGGIVAAALILAVWFMDRLDGQLARSTSADSPRGAWLDANVDELVDVALHAATAAAAARGPTGSWAWMLLAAFLGGKYLLMYGLGAEEACGTTRASHANCEKGRMAATHARSASVLATLAKRLYHLPANADVRIHVLALAVGTGWLTAELAAVAAYYNLRWMARYALVLRRLPAAWPKEAAV